MCAVCAIIHYLTVRSNVPAVFETFGAACEGFEKWFKDTMKRKDKEDKATGAVPVSWTAHTTSSYWQQRISIALQVGNARVIHRRAARDNEQAAHNSGV